MTSRTVKKLACILLAALVILVYGWRLWFPSEPYYDEVHYVNFFRQLIYHDTYALRSNCHPPLWHLLVVLCIELFGDHAFSWRIISLLSHFGVLVMTYLLAKKLTEDKTTALITLFILLFDCLSLTQARIAMMNPLMLLFILSSIYFFLDVFLKGTPYNHSRLRLAGIFWALALATKLVSVNLLFFFAPIIVFELIQRPGERVKIIGHIAVYFFLFPVLLIFLVHLFVPFLKDSSWHSILDILKFNFDFNRTSRQFHPYASQWWSWPLLLRPINFFFKAHDWDSARATCETVLAIGNPVIFWSIPLTMAYLAFSYFQKESRAVGIILLGFLSQWISFGLMGRTQFFHYFYQVMPFIAVGIAVALNRICAQGRWGKYSVIFYLTAVAGMFVYWYPLLTGMTISRAYFYQHMWFRCWI